MWSYYRPRIILMIFVPYCLWGFSFQYGTQGPTTAYFNWSKMNRNLRDGGQPEIPEPAGLETQMEIFLWSGVVGTFAFSLLEIG